MINDKTMTALAFIFGLALGCAITYAICVTKFEPVVNTIDKAKKVVKKPMTDREIQHEIQNHVPTVSDKVYAKLLKMKEKFIKDNDLRSIQDLAGVDLGHGYSIRYKQTFPSIKIVCHSYNYNGKFYSTQEH